MSAAATSHPELPQHVVTAVLVSHDGERWLPEVLAALTGQRRPVQDVVAADTGSADRSADLVTEALGPERVLHLARRSGFGTAVAEAARTAPLLTPDDLPYLKRPSGWDPVTRTWHDDAHNLPEFPHGEPIHWLWLLHDDSAPEPDALAHLLRQADADPRSAIIGPKLRSWYDSRQLLETGVTIAPSGRRWTGLDRREQDQGQHDQSRAVLAVSTAGMLIRRDVFDRLGGFDRHLPLMRDDVDLCWRAHHAGLRVRVEPRAVVRHAEASSRERRSIDCAGRVGGRQHRVDKAAAVYTLLTNTRSRHLPWVMLRILLGTVLRVLAYLLGKDPGRAVDEATGLLATLLRPGRLLAARRQRRTTTSINVDPADLRPLFPPPGATLKATAEAAVSAVSTRSAPAAGASRHGAVESGPTDDDADTLDVEQFARARQLLRRPGPLLVLLLVLAAAAASRDLFGAGSLFGGALLPAPGEASELWARYRETWQPLGVGGVESAPPYLGLLALFAAPLLGDVGLLMSLLLIGAVPLAGASAYLCSKPLVTSRLLRAWGSAVYAVLPALTGAIAAGRIGTVLLAILLPPLARCAITAVGLNSGSKGPWRAAWAGALLLALVTAFTPVLWALGLLLAVCALLRPPPGQRGARAARLAVLIGVPVVLLAPWSLTVLRSPDQLLAEAGLSYPTDAAGALSLLGANPAGPGTPTAWLFLGLLLAALAALLRQERRRAVAAAWVTALAALLVAVWADGDAHWAGPATLVYGLALIAAALLGADGARHRVAASSFGWRQPVAVAIAATAALGPATAAAGWVADGAGGPVERSTPVQVPAFVAQEASTTDQARTLVLASDGETADGATPRLDYALVRGAGTRLGDADITDLMPENHGLGNVVADLAAGSGADQAERLGDYAIRYILVRDDSAESLHQVLNTTPGLMRLSQEDGSALWRVATEVSRATVLPPEDDPSGVTERLDAGPVEIDTEVPDGPAGRTVRLAETQAPGWQATLDGAPLAPVQVDGWAQGFELPEGGGRLQVTYETSGTHGMWVWGQAFALLVLAVLALPGRRGELDDDLPEEGAATPRRHGRGPGRAQERHEGDQEAETGQPGDPGAEPDDRDPAPYGEPPQTPVHVPAQASAPESVPQPPGGHGTVPPQHPGHAPGEAQPQWDPGAGYDPYAYQQAPRGYEGYEGVQGYDGGHGYDGGQGYDGNQGYGGEQGYRGDQGYDPNRAHDPNQGYDYQQNYGNWGDQSPYEYPPPPDGPQTYGDGSGQR